MRREEQHHYHRKGERAHCRRVLTQATPNGHQCKEYCRTDNRGRESCHKSEGPQQEHHKQLPDEQQYAVCPAQWQQRYKQQIEHAQMHSRESKDVACSGNRIVLFEFFGEVAFLAQSECREKRQFLVLKRERTVHAHHPITRIHGTHKK